MSLEQYKDANRKELWEILQIQVERIAKLEEKLWRTEQEAEQAVNRAVEMIEHKDGRIAELEKLGNEMEIIIADLRAHLKIRGE